MLFGGFCGGEIRNLRRFMVLDRKTAITIFMYHQDLIMLLRSELVNGK